MNFFDKFISRKKILVCVPLLCIECVKNEKIFSLDSSQANDLYLFFSAIDSWEIFPIIVLDSKYTFLLQNKKKRAGHAILLLNVGQHKIDYFPLKSIDL